MHRKVDVILQDAAATFKERNLVYKDTYKQHGQVAQALFPSGLKLETVLEHNRFACLTMIIGKLVRYSMNFKSGGHLDSIHDIIVYAAMLEELDLGIQEEVSPYKCSVCQRQAKYVHDGKAFCTEHEFGFDSMQG